MNNSTYKSSFLEAYVSEEKEENNINDLQSEFDNILLYQHVNMNMNNMEMEMNMCMDMDTNMEMSTSDMNVDTKDNCDRESMKISCQWKANICLSDYIIRATSMCKNHKHPLSNDIQNTETKFHRLSSEMLEEIEFLTDAAKTYKRLIKLQRKEHGWFVKARLEGEDNNLIGLFWMRDVAINDNISYTNKYYMYLSLTIIVDNHARFRIAAVAVVSDVGNKYGLVSESENIETVSNKNTEIVSEVVSATKNGRAQCTYCKTKLKHNNKIGTSSLIRHIKYTKYNKYIKDVSQQELQFSSSKGITTYKFSQEQS
ncbi:hypothetical protein C2G38_2201715 [Gigaspora rosea]|uniref:BED-type domain-containing protein n=1 Tax=Gigaspora rosea TaxID=44941 RepID=A0A397UPG6_9GLOM|nr:hypothetical protein C2G38_2201715 [Gigaspora rosea]